MPTQIPPPTPQPLHSILLIAKTRSGPRLVAYYPPSPPQRHLQRQHPRTNRPRNNSSSSSSSDSSSSSSGTATPPRPNRSEPPSDTETSTSTRRARKAGRGVGAAYSADEDKRRDDDDDDGSDDGDGTATARRNGAGSASTLDELPPFGLEGADRKAESLARLLAPSSRDWHKRRFEVGIEGFVFLGCAVFEREGGGWGGRRTRRGKKGDKEEAAKMGRDKGEGTKAGAGEGEGEENGTLDEEEEEEGVLADSEASAGENMQRKPVIHADDDIDDEEEGDNEDQEDSNTASSSPAAPRPAKPDQSPQLPDPGTSMPTSSMQSASTAGHSADTAPESLSMFNLVFVLQPPQAKPAAYQSTVHDMYTHVVKQLSKALAHQQRRHGFVWTETRLIASLLSSLGDSDADARKHGEHTHDAQGSTAAAALQPPARATYAAQWPRVAAKSELARAMATTYESIARGYIVHLTLGPGLSLSLQIPQVQKTAVAPTPMAPDTGGALWLTTYDASTSNETDGGGAGTASNNNNHHHHHDNGANGAAAASSSAASGISPYSALLLLEDREVLAREIAAQPATGVAVRLAFFARHCVPTKTLAQLARNLKLSLHEVQRLSLHLIHYRRAIAILPLHTSHTYIVSPNADFRNLPQASHEFGRRFAMLPSLVAILGKMSAVRASAAQGPQPWGTMIPSTDHKAAYMEILEWLVRGGWVTQLRTFCWVRVSAETKAKVARRMRVEEREAAAREAAAAAVSEEEFDGEDSSDVGERPRNSSGGSVDAAAAALSPRLRAHLVPPRPPSEAGSTGTARTAVRVSNLKSLASKKGGGGHDGASTKASVTSHEHRVSDGSTKAKAILDGAPDATLDENGAEIVASDFEPSIVDSPQKANALESRWLEHVAGTLPGEDLRRAWPKLVKYFDGAHALEEIAPREGWKRKFVAPLLMKMMREDGLLLTVRHW